MRNEHANNRAQGDTGGLNGLGDCAQTQWWLNGVDCCDRQWWLMGADCSDHEHLYRTTDQSI